MSTVAFTINAKDGEVFASDAFDGSVGKEFNVTNRKTGTLDRAVVSDDGKSVMLTCSLSLGGTNYDLTSLSLPMDDHYIQGPVSLDSGDSA